MVRFELVNDDCLEYAYYPEGNGRAGNFKLSENGEVEKFTKSLDDERKTYLIMAFNKVRRIYKETGKFPEEGMSAWY